MPVSGTAPTQLEGEEDFEAVKRFLQAPTVEGGHPTRELSRAEPTRRAGIKPKPAPVPPAPPVMRTALVAGGAAAVVAGVVGWQLLRQPSAPAATVDVPALMPPGVSLPAATVPPVTSVAAPLATTVVATLPGATPPPATLRPAPSAPPPTPPPTPRPTPPPTTAPTPPPTTVATPPPTTTPPATTQPPKPSLTPEQGVRLAITEFASALSRLDKDAVLRIFPNFPQKNFEGLANFKAYKVDVEVKKLDVQPSRVVVETRVHHRFTSFSGKEDSNSRNERMIFIEGGASASGWVRVE
jgi:hypothetical protein